MRFHELKRVQCAGLTTDTSYDGSGRALWVQDKTPSDDLEVCFPLGKGAYSNVYQVKLLEEGSPECAVALKIFKCDSRFADCALAEAAYLERVSGALKKDILSNVLGFLEAVNLNGHVGLLLETAKTDMYSHQKKVFEAAASGSEYDQFPLDRLAVDLYSGLCVLHHEGITHGDLKPENVLICERQGVKLAVIADLGSAREASKTRTDGFEVSPWYRAPEIFCRGHIGTSSDVWAAACVLYEYAFGVPLFCVTRGSWARTKRESSALYKAHCTLLGLPPSDYLIGSPGVHDAPRRLPSCYTLRHEDEVNLRLAQDNFTKFPDFSSILVSCLVWRPQERSDAVTAQVAAQSLGHEGSSLRAAIAPPSQ